eukprot:15434333-Alexandrium_andersonii.AAC.1
MDLGFSARLRVYVDSSAAIGICRRAGVWRGCHWRWASCGFRRESGPGTTHQMVGRRQSRRYAYQGGQQRDQ